MSVKKANSNQCQSPESGIRCESITHPRASVDGGPVERRLMSSPQPSHWPKCLEQVHVGALLVLDVRAQKQALNVSEHRSDLAAHNGCSGVVAGWQQAADERTQPTHRRPSCHYERWQEDEWAGVQKWVLRTTYYDDELYNGWNDCRAMAPGLTWSRSRTIT